jgi:hypothetical protein
VSPPSNNTLNVSRAFLGESLAYKTGNAIAKGSPCASRPRCPGSSYRLDQGLAIGQTPAKQGSSRRPLCHRNPATRSMLRVPYRATPLRTNRGQLRREDRRALRGPWLPGSLCRLDQGRAVGQTPAKPGLSRWPAVLPESNNTLNVSRAFWGESLAHEPGELRKWIAVRFAAPMPRIFVSAGSGARRRADPCKTGLIGEARRAT